MKLQFDEPRPFTFVSPATVEEGQDGAERPGNQQREAESAHLAAASSAS